MKRCVFCGCTDERACIEPRSHETCEWLGDDWLPWPACSFCYLLNPIARFCVDAAAAHQLAAQVPIFTSAQHERARLKYAKATRPRSTLVLVRGAGA